MDKSSRLSLPLLAPGQGQKEMTHNEALTLLEMLVQPVVEEMPMNAPPAVPERGRLYVLGNSPTSEFSDHHNALAMMTDGGWRFVEVPDGGTVRLRNGTTLRFANGSWTSASVMIDGEQVVGPRASAIAEPSGGGTVDIEARVAIDSILQTLRSHGLIAT